MKMTLMFVMLAFGILSNAQTKFIIQYDASGNRIRQNLDCPLKNKDLHEPLVSRLEIFPNPANTQTNLSFRVEKAGQLGIMVFSATNVKVKEVYSGAAVVDNYHFDIDLGNLPSAVYFIQLRLADRAKNYKLVVIH
ncbi:MAG TPA: T9SS type A sorting domain-containing protein [Haliscomenobacter sp.]|uniref:T9SS type A sorting domain-containing protein n=1 Tax=Haliscomenobacter sp. TaxID=2717303 RepID=UPI002BDB4809|nr:T9SS type A sorting domain-containing protein [Haliscomenobacter sp.]HOY21397.1 T9SS type A sorting domain-containing protein [Haliscomenobacter sp.]